jgi:hypothetical protein
MKGLALLAGLGIIAAAAAAAAWGRDWDITVVDEGHAVGMMCSLALDAAGNPHISYCDISGQHLKYAYFDGTSWQVEVVDSESASGQYSDLALDSAGHPHISYSFYRTFPYPQLRYAYFDGNAWRISTVDREGGMHTSIALDAQDRPHISYGELIGPKYSNLRYAYYDGAQWRREVLDTGASAGYSTSIALDSRNRPHISYQDDYLRCWLKYAYYDGARWQITTVDKSLNATGMESSIAVDAAGRPHISYQEDISEALKYAYFDGTQWRITAVDEGDVQLDTCVALDESGRAHITYHTERNVGGQLLAGDLKYAYFDGAAWRQEVIAPGKEGDRPGIWNSLALDAAGVPHVAFCRSVGYFGFSSLEYAYPLEGYLDHFAAAPKGYDAIALGWSVRERLSGRVTGYNVYGREKGEPEWSRLNGTLLPGGDSGSYDHKGLPCLRTYEYLLEGIVDGNTKRLGLTKGTTAAPRAHVLFAPRPNPSSTSAVIAFELMARADVDLSVYDLSGRKVATLAAGWLPPGGHECACDVSALAPGVYVYRMTAGDWTGARKMVVVR